jgi:UDP-glucose 4-epimerase
MQSLRILLTGANGFIGQHLCKKLLSHRHQVIVLAHSEVSQSLNILKNDQNLTLVRGDIRDTEFTGGLFRNYPVEVVFHLAIAPPENQGLSEGLPLQNSEIFQTNFKGTLNLLAGAREAKTRAWVQSSTMSVYNYETPDYVPVDEKHPTNPRNIYGFSKLVAERACQYYSNMGLPTIILRYSGVFGSGKNNGMIAAITKNCLKNSNHKFEVANNRTSDFIYVDEVVSANILALKKIFDPTYWKSANQISNKYLRIYNIGSGEEISALDITKLIRELCGNNSVKVDEVEGNPRRFYFNIAAARKELGYSPVSVRQGLKDYIETEKRLVLETH